VIGEQLTNDNATSSMGTVSGGDPHVKAAVVPIVRRTTVSIGIRAALLVASGDPPSNMPPL
jgi:hypothetical protein